MHGLSHSTGHQKRLAREGISELAPFGSPVCSREELVANFRPRISAPKQESRARSFRIKPHTWAGWLKKLRDDRKLLILAAAQAQRAADYILGRRCGE